MITRVSTITELKQLYVEQLLNKTDKVTAVADQSINNGIAYGVAKIGQKALKDIAISESYKFPDYAFGIHLDNIAENNGIAGRFGASKSSTYIRLVATPSTTYIAGTHQFFGEGEVFELIQDVTVGDEGYVYAKVRSQSEGQKTNAPALTINEVSPQPIGHLFVTNEYQATGGANQESDETFRLRIKKGANLAARGTLQYITQVMLKFNQNVLKVFCYGVNNQNQVKLAIATQNGADLTENELSQLSIDIAPYLCLTDYNSVTNNSIGVELSNIEYEPIDISFRAELVQSTSVDQIRKEIQIEMSKYFDVRYWDSNKKVEWDDLLEIVKSHPSIKYVADSFFNPNTDVTIQFGKLPRVRGFIVLDLEGNLILDNNGILDPIYYPQEIDQAFQQTIL